MVSQLYMKIFRKRRGIGSFVGRTILSGEIERVNALFATKQVGEIRLRMQDLKSFVSGSFHGCETSRIRFAAGFTFCVLVMKSMLAQRILQISVIGLWFCGAKVTNFLLICPGPVNGYAL
jgi:hypothetical protein